MMNHPLYPKRCDIDDPDYENICPFFEKLKTPTPDYEDPSDISEEILKKRLVWYWFNNKAKLITLVEANIEFCNGKPKNPVKTGIKGRGILSKFGPQHAADPVVTCWFDNRLYFVGILREDVNEWYSLLLFSSNIEPFLPSLHIAEVRKKTNSETACHNH